MFRADLIQRTIIAKCLSCRAYLSAEQHRAVAEVVGALRRQQLSHFTLDRLGIFGAHKAQTVAKPYKMRIGDHGRLAVDIAHNQVCRFSADARQTYQLLYSIRHLAAKLLTQHFSDADKAFGFCLEKSAYMYYRGDIVYVGSGKAFGVGEPFEQLRRHHVYGLIAALG